MKLQIEIEEEDAALIFSNNWGAQTGATITEIVQSICQNEANDFRNKYPESTDAALHEFRLAQDKEARKALANAPKPPLARVLAQAASSKSHYLN